MRKAYQQWNQFYESVLSLTAAQISKALMKQDHLDRVRYAKRVREMTELARKRGEESCAADFNLKSFDDSTSNDDGDTANWDNQPVCEKCFLLGHSDRHCSHTRCRICKGWGHTREDCMDN